jgi:hypothetical protein
MITTTGESQESEPQIEASDQKFTVSQLLRNYLQGLKNISVDKERGEGVGAHSCAREISG